MSTNIGTRGQAEVAGNYFEVLWKYDGSLLILVASMFDHVMATIWGH